MAHGNPFLATPIDKHLSISDLLVILEEMRRCVLYQVALNTETDERISAIYRATQKTLNDAEECLKNAVINDLDYMAIADLVLPKLDMADIANEVASHLVIPDEDTMVDTIITRLTKALDKA